MADVGGITADQLRSYIERIERLDEDRKAVASDIKDVFAEAKGNGFDTKIMRQVLRLRRMDRDDRAEQESLLDLYMHALGMTDDARNEPTPMEAAIGAAGGTIPQIEIAGAAALGMVAARMGDDRLTNPFVQGDPRRRLWDEGWQTSAADSAVPRIPLRRRAAPNPEPAEAAL